MIAQTEKYNAAFVAHVKSARRLEEAYRSMRGIKEARAAYESARRAHDEARNEIDEREKGGEA